MTKPNDRRGLKTAPNYRYLREFRTLISELTGRCQSIGSVEEPFAQRPAGGRASVPDVAQMLRIRRSRSHCGVMRRRRVGRQRRGNEDAANV